MLATVCAPALLSLALARAAVGEGAGLAAGRRGYAVLPWVLWQSRDPLRAVHGRAGVDAVIVETPYERLRYDGYLQRLQGLPITPAFIDAERAKANRTAGFVAYVHSVDDDDRERSLLTRYRARVTQADGRNVRPEAAVPFGPSEDFYDVGTFREQRYVGSITFRFADLASSDGTCTPRGTLHLSDGARLTMSFPYDLRHFR